jgi:hypothetical protein
LPLVIGALAGIAAFDLKDASFYLMISIGSMCGSRVTSSKIISFAALYVHCWRSRPRVQSSNVLMLIRPANGARIMKSDGPEPKPDLLLKIWPIGIAASGVPGIIGVIVLLVIVLSWLTLLRPFGY